jgi:hypothetical protein
MRSGPYIGGSAPACRSFEGTHGLQVSWPDEILASDESRSPGRLDRRFVAGAGADVRGTDAKDVLEGRVYLRRLVNWHD